MKCYVDLEGKVEAKPGDLVALCVPDEGAPLVQPEASKRPVAVVPENGSVVPSFLVPTHEVFEVMFWPPDDAAGWPIGRLLDNGLLNYRIDGDRRTLVVTDKRSQLDDAKIAKYVSIADSLLAIGWKMEMAVTDDAGVVIGESVVRLS